VTPELFPDLPDPVEPSPTGPTRPSEARVLRPVRNQVEWMPRDLDSLLPEDHPVPGHLGLA